MKIRNVRRGLRPFLPNESAPIVLCPTFIQSHWALRRGLVNLACATAHRSGCIDWCPYGRVRPRPFAGKIHAMIDLIAFDADDTLWHNETLYSEARGKFEDILRPYGLPDNLDEILHDIEVANLSYFGYGVTGFVISLIETAVRATDGAITGPEIQALLDVSKEMISAEVRVYDRVEETLAGLAARYPLALVTKGDLLHQRGKVARSGLARYFSIVEVMSHKSTADYEAFLNRVGVAPERFIMIGNSMRSDVLPVLELGCLGVYVPAEDTWVHETAAAPEGADGRFFEIGSLDEVVALMKWLEGGDYEKGFE